MDATNGQSSSVVSSAAPLLAVFMAHFLFVSFRAGRRSGGGHTTGVLVFGGDEWKSFGGDESGYWIQDGRRGGVLFNHVPFFSGEVDLIRTGYALQSEFWRKPLLKKAAQGISAHLAGIISGCYDRFNLDPNQKVDDVP